jgi:hypothetical protein
MLSRNVEKEILFRKNSPWEYLSNEYRSADLVIGNLEGTIGPAGPTKDSISVKPIFGFPKDFISMLSDAGFNALSLENNHSLDFGKEYKDTTISELHRKNIRPVYFNNSPQFFNIGEVKIALLSINLVSERANPCQQIPSLEVKQKLRLAAALSNLVIVSIHWGSELLDWTDKNQPEKARWLTENGADLIIGHHPHVVQNPEIINGKPVFFSLGNHLFDQKYESTKEGLVVEVKISGGYLKCRGLITHTRKNSFYPEIVSVREYNFPKSKIRKSLIVSNVEMRPVSVNENNINQIILEGKKNSTLLFQSSPKPIIYIAKCKLDGKNDFLLTLEKHYSSIDNEINLRPYVYSVTHNGLVDLWRGSALAWPILDAVILPENDQILCALHRGDSFINLKPENKETRVALYMWNGFGFSGYNDEKLLERAKEYFMIYK